MIETCTCTHVSSPAVLTSTTKGFLNFLTHQSLAASVGGFVWLPRSIPRVAGNPLKILRGGKPGSPRRPSRHLKQQNRITSRDSSSVSYEACILVLIRNDSHAVFPENVLTFTDG